jgi:hypothetical protein
MNTKNSKKTISTTVFAAIIVFSMLAISTAPASAATEDEIAQAIVNGTAYLDSVQNGDGSWGTSDKAAVTGLVLLKLQEYATRELRKDPYDNDPTSPTYYVYADNVIAGMDYMLGEAVIDAEGIYFAPGHHEVYTTGIALCALGVSDPDRTYNIGGTDYTYKAIAQNVTDWLADAQSDSGTCEGGWGYTANDEAWCDNSNSGYAILGLAYAEDFGCTIPPGDNVRFKLNKWINTIQDTSGTADDGGSWYRPSWSWVNILKTGNLLQQMAFCGDDLSVQRVLAAIDYLERHWRDASNSPGWGYSLDPSDYQAMFTTMKGLTSMEIDLIDTDGDGVQDNDWFNQEPSVGEDFASTLVAQQNPDGSWPSNCNYGNDILCTTWALLTLEKIGGIPPDPWKEINKELDALIGNVSNATMPNIIKQRLVDKLVYAKELKDNAHEECLADNFIGATKKLGVAKNQVGSFASMVEITRRISAADKASFLADATEIIGKIEKLIEHIETTDSC